MEKRVLRLVEKLFDDGIPGQAGDDAPSSVIPGPTGNLPFSKTVDKRHHEVNAVIGNRAPSLYDSEDRITAAVLCNILGGPASNSLLNRELREKNGWVYNVECNYTQYADTGIAAISFGCDKPNLQRCLTTLDRILTRLREEPLSERTLKAYKKQLLGQLAISSDNGEAQCLSMGKSLLAWGRIDTSAEMRSRIEAVTPEALQAMARRLFDPSSLSRLIYL
jgi:predicted Zn-dependent peptidase